MGVIVLFMLCTRYDLSKITILKQIRSDVAIYYQEIKSGKIVKKISNWMPNKHSKPFSEGMFMNQVALFSDKDGNVCKLRENEVKPI